MRETFWWQVIVSYTIIGPTNSDGEYKLGFEAATLEDAVLSGVLHMRHWLRGCSSNVKIDGFTVIAA